MAIPILHSWPRYFTDPDEGLGSSYERIILNDLLHRVCAHYPVQNLLEAPSFGFTGLSGINSMHLAKQGKEVTLVDHDAQRVASIEALWRSLPLPLSAHRLDDYSSLPFADDQFDLSWNFSALWFTCDLEAFLAELSRVTNRVILLCVPNRSGLGYISQALLGHEELKRELNEDHIKPQVFVPIMKKLGWKLMHWNYIDCPPWPDIGMPKEKFLKIFGLQWILPSQENNQPLSIMNYYRDEQPAFPEEMRQHAWFERRAPGFMKHFWAHHRYYLFEPGSCDE
jgi:hypothetical protein